MLLTNMRPTAEIFAISPEVTENNSLIPASDELQARFADLLRAPLRAELTPVGADTGDLQSMPSLLDDATLPPAGNALPLADDLAAGSASLQMSGDEVLPETASADPAALGLHPTTEGASGVDLGSPLFTEAAGVADSAAEEAAANALLSDNEAANHGRADDRVLADPLAPAAIEPSVSDAAARAAGAASAFDLRRTSAQGLPPTAAEAAIERASGRTRGPQWQDIRSRNPVEPALPAQAQASRGAGEPVGGPQPRALPVDSPAVNFAAQIADSAGDRPEVLPRHTLESIAPSPGSAAIDTAAARESASTIARGTPLQTTIPLALGDDGWGEAFGERVTWLSRGGIQSAELKLHPAELGPIRVQVAVEDDAAKLTFTAPHAATREAIEQALPRLREMLSESGLTLAGTDINDTSTREDQAARRDAAGEPDRPSVEEGDLAAEAEPLPLPKKPSGLVDTFA